MRIPEIAAIAACLALGVAAISGVGSLSRALSQGLVSQGQSILGGDVSASRVHRQATAEDRAFFAASGKVSEVASLRAMARLPQAAGAPARAQTLVEIKAVDGAYPLYGELELGQGGDPASAPARALLQILAPRGGVYGAAAEPALLARLGLKPGDRIKVGDMELEVRAAIASEPDRLSSGLSIGPRLMISLDALAASGLVRPGSLVTWDYRIRLPETRRGAEGIASFTAEAEARGPRAGWRIRSRAGAAPGLQRSIDRLAQILTLVGLTVLVVGGVGIANAVRGHLDVDLVLGQGLHLHLAFSEGNKAGEHQVRIGVFVIDHEQAVFGRAVDRNIADIIVVVAKLLGLCRSTLLEGIELRRVCKDRVAPT